MEMAGRVRQHVGAEQRVRGRAGGRKKKAERERKRGGGAGADGGRGSRRREGVKRRVRSKCVRNNVRPGNKMDLINTAEADRGRGWSAFLSCSPSSSISHRFTGFPPSLPSFLAFSVFQLSYLTKHYRHQYRRNFNSTFIYIPASRNGS